MTWKPDNSHRDLQWLKELQAELENPVLKQLDSHEYRTAILTENASLMQAKTISDSYQQESVNDQQHNLAMDEQAGSIT